MARAGLADGHEDAATRDRNSERSMVPDADSSDLVRPRIDPRQRAVELVAHPDSALIAGDGRRAVSGRDSRDRVRQRIDARDGPVEAVRYPDRAVTVSDSGGAVSDVDRHDCLRLRIDPHYAIRCPFARPQSTAAEGELGRGD